MPFLIFKLAYNYYTNVFFSQIVYGNCLCFDWNTVLAMTLINSFILSFVVFYKVIA